MTWKVIQSNNWQMGRRTFEKAQARHNGAMIYREITTDNGTRTECYYMNEGPVYYTLEKLIQNKTQKK